MNLERLAYLYRQQQTKQATEDERKEWESMVLDPLYEEAIQQFIADAWQQAKETSGISETGQIEQEQIYNYIIAQKRQHQKRIGIGRWVGYAAAVICALTIGIWLVGKDDLVAPKQLAHTAIVPGGNKAILTLADGSVVDLSVDHPGIVMTETGIRYSNGEAVIANGKRGEAHDPKINLLTLQIPKGGTYQVTLPDSTKVWLNSESTLQYPSEFDKAERTVSLVGEAYFEVKEDKARPFHVATAGQRIEVLGTQFNVTAYENEVAVKTTLVEGSVKVTNLQAGIGNVLKPGQQSVVTNGDTKIITVSTATFTAWKDGYFNFEETPFPEVMEQLARWYDLEIEYKQKPVKTFSGTMKRDVQLETVLSFFEDSGIRFRVEERKLIIG